MAILSFDRGNDKHTLLSQEEDFAQANRLVLIVAILNIAFVLLYIGSALDAQNPSYPNLILHLIFVEVVLMIGVIAYTLRVGFDNLRLPNVALSVFLLFDSMLYIVMGYVVLFSFLLTIILCARYHNIQLVWRFAIAGGISLLLAGFIGFTLDALFPIVHEAHNYLGLDYDNIVLFTLDHIPATCVYLLACVISYGITKSGVGLLQSNVGLARARSDMEAAANIQQQLIPSEITFDEAIPFEFCAAIEPMNMTSGDYYDAAVLGDYCFFEIADVSDKGLPAAMFAMRAQSLLRQSVTEMSLLEGVLAANRALCQNNESCMFVTLLVGMLDLKTGHVSYINAGHELPVLKSNGTVELLESNSPDPALGLFDDASFQVHDVMFKKGDILFMYTDGITDAENGQGDRFGAGRLTNCINSLDGANAQDVCSNVRRTVSDFCGAMSQNDDMTILAFGCKENPEGFTISKTIECNTKSLGAATSYVLGQLTRVCCPLEACSYVGTIIDEIGSNIIEHAFEDTSGRVFEMECRIKPTSVCFHFIDEGVAFNPLVEEEGYIGSETDAINDLQIGGWGVHLVCSLANSVSYERIDERNILTVELNW